MTLKKMQQDSLLYLFTCAKALFIVLFIPHI